MFEQRSNGIGSSTLARFDGPGIPADAPVAASPLDNATSALESELNAMSAALDRLSNRVESALRQEQPATASPAPGIAAFGSSPAVQRLTQVAMGFAEMNRRIEYLWNRLEV
jgi:hypothetical protein